MIFVIDEAKTTIAPTTYSFGGALKQVQEPNCEVTQDRDAVPYTPCC